METPDLAEHHLNSFNWLIEEGIKSLLEEFSPIEDYSGKKFTMTFKKFELGEPKFDEFYAKANKITLEAPMRITVNLQNKTLGLDKDQEIFFADIPMMTNHGTFIINGVERVIVPQLARSFGVFFTSQLIKGLEYFGAKIIPGIGAWLEVESENDGALYIKIDRKRKFPATALLHVFGLNTKEEMLALFDGDEVTQTMIAETYELDPAKDSLEEAYLEIYKRLRDGDLATFDNAREFVDSIFATERYDISKVGRFRFNKRFGRNYDDKTLAKETTLSLEDLKDIFSQIAHLNVTPGATPDDIDHLSSRRVRLVGELLHQKMRVGFTQMRRNIQDRMSTSESDVMLPVNFISPRPLQARVKEFFTTNQLSQFMLQENILSEMTHLRTVSALGPGGLTRERAGFEVRDLHTSHYGRLCPIQTPEGPNIGLILRLATYARINQFGMIETPYARVENSKITGEIVYLDALEEEKYVITNRAVNYDDKGVMTDDSVEARKDGVLTFVKPEVVDFMDVSTNQAYSVATSMIPFLSHDDANRALMGSNMQKQANPCIVPQAPLVGTGIEGIAARNTGRLVLAEEDGEITAVDGKHIILKGKSGKTHNRKLINYSRTNGFTAAHQRPVVSVGDKVKRGDLLADMSSSVEGQMAIGQNVLVAFMSWAGNNYEDAIILSERLVKKNMFTSIHMDEFDVSVRDTKLGEEQTTHDIPNVGEAKLKNLDEEGVVRIGADVRPGDILVGKITPKGETQLTPEERLLRSIFGEKARDVKDTSKRMENGKQGRVTSVKVFSRENGDKLEASVIKKVSIGTSQLRNVTVGDKLAGRHGNKGVISKIMPEEDMPYMPDGTPIDVILTPLGVPSRMNLGQILEMHLGLAADTLGYQAVVPPFAGASVDEIKDELEEAGFNRSGKIELFDGRTGEKFAQDIAVGYMYILKLHHMVEDKIHMRSTGPYSLITQQPLGGRAQQGGQRFGEMEVWALLGYGAAYTLREILTIKSDDIQGRSSAFDSIIKGELIEHPNIPASFNVLVNNLRGLALDIEVNEN